MDDLSHLIQEANRVIAAPYPILLDPLYHLVRHDKHLLPPWTRLKACHIEPLVKVIRSNLTRQRCASDLLLLLFHNAQFKDDILRQDPQICEFLVQQQQASSVEAAGAAMFLTPCWRGIPSIMTHFLELALNQECQVINSGRSSSSNIRRIIRANTAKVLETVSEDNVLNLMQTCQHLLITKHAEIEILNSVLIQGLVYQAFYRSPDHDQSSFSCWSSPTSSLLLRWAEKAASMFNGKRTTKNLENTVLLAIHFCQPTKGIDESQALDAMEMVLQIVQMMDLDAVQQFGRARKDILQKLTQKASHKGLSFIHRLVTLNVLLALRTPATSSGITPIIEMLVTDITATPGLVEVDTFTGLNLLLSGIWRGLLYADPSKARELFKVLFSFVTEGCEHSCIARIREASRVIVASLLMESLNTYLRECDDTRRFLEISFEVIDDVSIPTWWDFNLSGHGIGTECHASLWCPQQLERTRLEVVYSVSVLVMQVACVSGKTLSRSIFDRVTGQAEMAMVTKAKYRCEHPVSTIETLHPSIRPIPSSASNGVSMEWQRRLDKILSTHHESVQQDLVALVHDVCLDLQRRCDNIEEPLRTAEARAQRLQLRTEGLRGDLKVKNDEMTRLTHIAAETSHKLNVTLAEAAAAKEALQNETRGRAQHHNHLLRQVAHAEREVARTALTTKEVHEQLQLGNKIELMKLTDELDLAKKEVVRLEVDLMWHNEQIGLLHEETNMQHAAGVEQIKAVHADEIARTLKHVDDVEKSHAEEKEMLLKQLAEARVRYQRVVAAVRD